MNYRTLGTTGLKVSDYCLGADNFGDQTDESEAIRIMSMAADGGVNFIDTANTYVAGKSEEIVGRFIKTRRSEIVLATKGRSKVGDGPNDVGTNRKYLLQAIDDSLRRLNTDYVDLYQIHSFDSDTPIDEMLSAMEDIVRSGKARYIGCSNFSGPQLVESLWKSDRNGWSRFVSVQPRYNLLYREPERELLPACVEYGIGVIPYSPQAGGFLLGKHRNFQAEAGGRFSDTFRAQRFYQNTYWNEWCFEAIERFMKVTSKYGVSPMALALGWVRANPVVSACIVGARNSGQLSQNLVAWEELVPREALNEASEIGDWVQDNCPWRG